MSIKKSVVSFSKFILSFICCCNAYAQLTVGGPEDSPQVSATSCSSSCTPPKVQNADCSCDSQLACSAPLVQNPSTSDCNCPASCTPQQVRLLDCNCGCLTSCPPGQTQDPTTCACCNPNVSSGLVNFEEFSESANIANEPHRSLLLKKYGIQFDAITGGNLAIAKVVNYKDEEPNFEAWLSVLCEGMPRNNRVCNGGNVGGRVLSMTNAKDTRTAELSLTLVEPVQSLSFDIIDVDGGETWTVTATDRDGKRISSQKVSSSGYGGSSGNNGATNFQVKTLGREIKSVRIHGTKKIDIFGFGFDNFITGITPCK